MTLVAVTGATSGIGEATARRLAAAGARVVAAGRRRERLKRLRAELGDGLVPVARDVTEAGATADLFRVARERLGAEPTAVVLCAGRGLPGTLLESDSGRWDELVRTNYLAVMHQLRESAELLAGQDAGASARDIVVIGSTVGRQVSPANPVYGSTKFAVHGLVEGLRQELCAHGIRVTLVEPGFVRSEFQAVAGYDGDWFDSLEREMGPFLTPDDVARTIEFVIGCPPHMHVDDVRVRPTRQRI